MYVCIYVNVCMHVFQTDLQAEHTVTQACRLVESLTHAQRERERDAEELHLNRTSGCRHKHDPQPVHHMKDISFVSHSCCT